MRRTTSRQQGQALLLVLVFLAVFLVLVWAGLRLASSSFLRLSAVQADTRRTYALDAGVDFAVEYMNLNAGTICVAPSPPPLLITYPSGTITVTVTITVVAGCKPTKAVYDVTITAGGSRTLTAEINKATGKPIALTWERYQ